MSADADLDRAGTYDPAVSFSDLIDGRLGREIRPRVQIHKAGLSGAARGAALGARVPALEFQECLDRPETTRIRRDAGPASTTARPVNPL